MGWRRAVKSQHEGCGGTPARPRLHLCDRCPSPATFLMPAGIRIFPYPSPLQWPMPAQHRETMASLPKVPGNSLLYLCLLPNSVPWQDDFKLKEIPFLSPKSRARGMATCPTCPTMAFSPRGPLSLSHHVVLDASLRTLASPHTVHYWLPPPGPC